MLCCVVLESGCKLSSSAGSGRGDSGNTHERLFGLHGELLMNKQTKKEVCTRFTESELGRQRL